MVALPPLVVPNAPSTRLHERAPTLVIVPRLVPFLSMPFPLLLDIWSCTHRSFQGKLNIFKTTLLRYTLHALQLTNLNCKIPVLGRSAGEGLGYPLQYSWTSLVAQLVKNLPSMQEFSSVSRSVQLLSRVRLFATPWTMQSMAFSRPEYWSA